MTDSEQKFEGRSAAEAAIKACEAFGVTRSEVDFKLVSETGEGIHKRVVIVATASNNPSSKNVTEKIRIAQSVIGKRVKATVNANSPSRFLPRSGTDQSCLTVRETVITRKRLQTSIKKKGLVLTSRRGKIPDA